MDNDVTRPNRRFQLSAPRRIVIAFAATILVGTALLSTDAATVGDPLSAVDALFMATSATCVTGLSVMDVGTELTTFGQACILGMIQLGGLGIMTMSMLFILIFTRGRLTRQGRDVLENAVTQSPMRDFGPLLRRAFLFTLVIELIAAVPLALRFGSGQTTSTAAWQGVFHSVSAFCNAGFSLNRDSLQGYASDITVNTIMILLITVGGLGFLVIDDLRRWIRTRRTGDRSSLSLHTRVVLLTSMVLVVAGTLGTAVLEWDGALAGKSVGDKIMASVFLSVTCRTAGFETVPTSGFCGATLLMAMILMFIGGSPGSTAGGIKTTTPAVLLAYIRSKFTGRESAEMGRRRIPQDCVDRAIMNLALGIFCVLVLSFLLLIWSPGGQSFKETAFEAVSALGTVGLSTGITADQSTGARLLLIMGMFVGRLGPITLALFLVTRPGSRARMKHPEESVMIG